MPSLPLVDHIERYIALSPLERARLGELPRRILKRKEVLVRPEERGCPLFYVEEGLLGLTGGAAPRERTYQFALEGWWLTDWSGFEGGRTEFEIQSVETTTVVSLDAAVHEGLLREVPALERYFRRVFQRAWAAAQRRLVFQKTQGAETLYRDFVARYPEFAQRVPQYMLASFLGFSPEFLSRIRSRRS